MGLWFAAVQVSFAEKSLVDKTEPAGQRMLVRVMLLWLVVGVSCCASAEMCRRVQFPSSIV